MYKSISIHNKWIKWSIHIVAWTIIIIFPVYFSLAFDGGDRGRLYSLYLHTASAAIIFYAGYGWLVPRFFLRDRKLMYFVLVGLLIVATFYVGDFIEDFFAIGPRHVKAARRAAEAAAVAGANVTSRPPVAAVGFYIHFLSSSLVSGFAMGLGVLEKLTQNERRQKELEKEKLNSELAFLKSQVSPHFFFNTLNNIYTLIGIDSGEAQEAVLKLSKLMRYLLYDSEDGSSKLQNEVDFMNHYIDLMKLRISPKVDLQIDLPGKVPDIPIAPLLFIAFIENAFKHGITYRDRSFIEIRMNVDAGKIRFETRNSIGRTSIEGEGRHSGIGLENVKKRLNLLYPDKHELRISRTNDTFMVKLEINLQ